MHVLSEHDPAGGHGMVMDPTAAAAHADDPAMPGEMTAPMDGPALSMSPSSDGGMADGMATCILFLVIGASVILLALLLRQGARKDTLPQRFSIWSGLSHRGPPGSGPPRISLCVLRV